MNPETIEIKVDNKFNDINDENDDAFSLRDLQMYDNANANASSTHSSPRTSSGQELFEFFHTLSNPPETVDIVFCGKVIPGLVGEGNDDHFTLVRSPSSRLPDPPAVKHAIPMRSASFSTSVKKMNITSLTSMSSKSRRRMFMFGPVKFLPEMEMSAIRERQGRRAPSQMFPVSEGGGQETTVKVIAGRHKNQRRDAVKRLTCRARLNTVFERSLACLRL
ncbi:uncharacterized protein LOC111888281 [Lactuca sativa]|uniref:Uncharacterized protein n=1 Tax=Lactuca sativa TaxID=4236 RepID=A0A9R1WBA1_LACSA|nr:uncharacterized protein LOC111888281 [Lactuca sativa]KAJ0221930.1 hypothetical protein LSAT_V11C200092410 [Lactuca sativa]